MYKDPYNSPLDFRLKPICQVCSFSHRVSQDADRQVYWTKGARQTQLERSLAGSVYTMQPSTEYNDTLQKQMPWFDILTGPRRCIYLNVNNVQRHFVWLYGFMDDGLIWLRNAVSCIPFRVLPGRNGAIISAYIGKILELTTVVEFARLARYKLGCQSMMACLQKLSSGQFNQGCLYKTSSHFIEAWLKLCLSGFQKD